MWSVAGTVIDQSHTNNDMISVYTTNTSNGILSVLTIRAVPIIAGNDVISIYCIQFSANQIKSATLTIRGTISHYNYNNILIYQIGISPVEDLNISSSLNNFLNISWSPPSLYSSDIPQGSIPTYHIQLVGDNILTATTTDTFYEFVNVSLCNTFNVSVTASVSNYTSNSVNTTNNNQSKLLCNEFILITLAYFIQVQNYSLLEGKIGNFTGIFNIEVTNIIQINYYIN